MEDGDDGDPLFDGEVDLEGEVEPGRLDFGVGSLTLFDGDLVPGELLRGDTIVGLLSRSGEGLGEEEAFLGVTGTEDLGTESFSFGYFENPFVGLGLESGLLSPPLG